MIPIKKPNFINSKYFYIDEKGWHLKEEAPDEIKDEFKKFMENFVDTPTGDIEDLN